MEEEIKTEMANCLTHIFDSLSVFRHDYREHLRGKNEKDLEHARDDILKVLNRLGS